MNPNTISVLRAVLTRDDGWRKQLDALLDGVVPMEIVEIRSYLNEKLLEVDEVHHQQISETISVLDSYLQQLVLNDDLLTLLASEINELLETKRTASLRINQLKDTVTVLMGADNTCWTGTFRIKTGKPAHSLRIVDQHCIPIEFLTPQPDRRAILAHFLNTGELIPGTDISNRRLTVTIKNP
jgi:hypothetical protein